MPKLKIVVRALSEFMENDLTTSAAAASYFSILVLFPALLLLLTIGSRIFGARVVEKYLLGQVLSLLPGAQSFVRKNLESISGMSTELIVSCAIVILWAASWLFTVIEKALNRVWGTYPRAFLQGRAVNFAVMSLVLTLLGASALVTAVITALRAAAGHLPLRPGAWFIALSGLAWQMVFIATSLAVTVALFTLLYKWLPNTEVPVTEALTGALIAGVLWEGAKSGFAYLLPYFHYDMLYGSIGAAIALLTWVYLSSNIMLLGAQITALLHRRHLLERIRGTGTSTDHVLAE